METIAIMLVAEAFYISNLSLVVFVFLFAKIVR